VEHEGRAGNEPLRRRARDFERVEPGGRIPQADAVAEAHLEPVTHPGLVEHGKCGRLHRTRLDAGLDRRQPGPQAREGDVVETGPDRRCLADAEGLDPDGVVARLHAPDLHMDEVAGLQ